jgi:hypothetical protein
MRNRFRDLSKLTKLLLIAPLAIAGMAAFVWIGGEVVKLLWNWLAPELLGLSQITFWQALGLLVLCRILFGGFGLSNGGASRRSGRMMEARIGDRIRERIEERWEEMSPEERERFRQRCGDRGGRTSPLDSNQSA